MRSRMSGALVYWNAHTGYGLIDPDGGQDLVGIYRADLLSAGLRKRGSVTASISLLALPATV